jgi:coenzyme PQQ synthesis protein D (PqqD)
VRNSPSGHSEIREAGALRLPHPNPAVVCCEVEQGAVLLSTEDETYYGLNPVGARIWALLPPVHFSLDNLCRELASSYPDASLEILQDDVLALLDDLLRNGLVKRV